MLDAVLLEWEGVLADTRDARRVAIEHALAAEGVADLPPADATLAQLVALRAERAFVEGLATGLVLTPGAADFVRHAHERTRVVIVTRATRAETEAVLRLSSLDDSVHQVVCADDVIGDSPSVAQYERALTVISRLRPVHRARIVAIVDGLPGIRAARAAGVRVLAVGTPAHESLEADGAVSSVDGLTMPELERIAGVASAEQER